MAAVLPPNLASLQLTSGSYRQGLKILVYGRSKTGKSFLAASAPGPIIALANVEPGIIPYLDPKRGDVGLEIHSAEDYYAAIDFAIKHENDFATFISDNDGLAWAQTMEDYEDTLAGRDIQGKDWRKIKGPRKAALRSLMRSKQNIIFTCWMKETVYQQKELAPGVEGGVDILKAELPDVEKTTLYFADLVLMTDVKKDKLSKPTSTHTVTFIGGRRPRTVSPDALYTGKTWSFDAKKPVNVWDTVIAPFHNQWVEGGSEHVGVDKNEAEYQTRQMEEAWQDQETGRLSALILQQATLAEYKKVWLSEVEVALNALDEKHKIVVRQHHEAKKKELGV